METHEQRPAADEKPDEERAKYSADQLKALKAKGHTFPGTTSYPIDDLEDLNNAIHAVGRGGADHDAIRKYIIGRAKAMGHANLIPDNWNADGSLKEKTENDPDEGEDGSVGQNNPYGSGGSMGSGDGTGSRSAKRAKKPRHRSGPTIGPEVRFRTNILEIRAASDDFDVVEVTGEPIVYDTPYKVRDMFGEFEETMRSGAASDCLGRGADVRFLFNHDGLPLARTSAGTLSLKDSPRALSMTARLDTRQQAANDLAVAIERGDVSQMSCGFIVGDDNWNEDCDERMINQLQDLLDVSAVTYPASPTTTIAVAQRMLMQATRTESKARIRQAWLALRELREGKVLSAPNQKLLIGALEALHAADDVDIPDIVTRLQDLDGAVDKGQAALAEVLGKANPDGDSDDLEPALLPADDDGRVQLNDGEDPDEETRDEAAEKKRKLALEAEYMQLKRRRAA